METTTRDAQGRFVPGCSGNPAGKKPGTLNYATIIQRRLREDDADTAVDALIAKARKGNLAAIRILLDRIDPKPRGRPVEFEFDEDMDLGRACRKVLKRISTGDITPAEGGEIVREIERTQLAEARAAANPLQRACISGSEGESVPRTAPSQKPSPVASAMGEGRVGATALAESPMPESVETPMPPPVAPRRGAPTSRVPGALAPSAAALVRDAHGGGSHGAVPAPERVSMLDPLHSACISGGRRAPEPVGVGA